MYRLIGSATRLDVGIGSCAFVLLAAGVGAVCMINSDSPTLPAAFLSEAAALLRMPGDRVVLGAAEDGGYYLIGLKQPHRQMFQRIDWSTSRVFAQSVARAAEI